MENKAYITFYIMLAVAYFIDVFVGLFIIDNNYKNLIPEYKYDGKISKLRSRVFDIIEIALLATIIIEIIIKIAFTTKLQKQVRFLLPHHYLGRHNKLVSERCRWMRFAQ
jgi:hypothetical protein